MIIFGRNRLVILPASPLIVFALLVFIASRAEAVPAFAEQTGQSCSACHIGGFGPRLTPFGRAFKLSGYTLRASTSFNMPASAMVVASYVHTAKNQPPVPHYSPNDNFTLDQASILVAGGAGDHFGGLTQFTYDGVGRAFSWDNLDVRFVDRRSVAGSDAIFGVSINNSPTVQDPWNTQVAWGFPYTGSDLMPAPAAAPIIGGGLAQSVVGLSAYFWWRSSVYVEAGAYWTPGPGFLRAVGADTSESGVLATAAPYFRVAYEKDFGDQNVEVGGVAFFPDLYPGGDRSAGSMDRYADLGADASYQFMGTGEDIFQVNTRYTNERQALTASYALGAAANLRDTLQDFRSTLSYYWHNEIGASVSFFDTWGSADAVLNVDSRKGTPNSDGFTLQADWTPFGSHVSSLGPRFNVRVGIQYTLYTEFLGATRNYDGFGHNASDHNALRLFTWFAF